MKKIILALNANDVNREVVDFACHISVLTNSGLTGVFIENSVPPLVPVMKVLPGHLYNEFAVADDLLSYKAIAQNRETNTNLFVEACSGRGISANVSFCDDIDNLIFDSRFADLLIIDPEMSFEEKKELAPTTFVKNVLSRSECPVIIAPYHFDNIDEILFAYDGSASSVFAIKQFTYLFSELSETKAVLLHVNTDDSDNQLQRSKISDLIKMHYNINGFRKLYGKPDEELSKYLIGKKNIFVVMGSYGKHRFPHLFERSTADLLLKAVNLPIFITHH
ncbi:MAG TPA: universal stress protein [Flavitalea sp.]|nr:universal stress protein [Flavitalea sp.]